MNNEQLVVGWASLPTITDKTIIETKFLNLKELFGV